MSYFGMHNHTDFSNGIVIDSTNKVGSLLTKAKEMNFTGLAITDHGNISSHVKAIQFMKQKRKEDDSWKNFKLALGEEIYLCENGRNKETMERGQRYPHCILIAKDAIGHEQLRHISSLAWERSFTMFITRIPSWYSDIEKAIGDKKGHLIMTSACVGGFIAENGWKKNDMVKAVELVNWAKEWFGDDFYLEMAPAAYPEQKEYNLWLISLAKSTNTKLTIATDAHYLRPEDREIHSAFLKSKEEERETADFYQYTYLMTSDEVHELMDDYIDKEIVNEALANTNIALNGIGEYDLFQSQTIPHLSDDRINNKDWKINLKNTKVRNKFEYINKYINSSQEDDQYFIYLGLLKLNEMKLPSEKLELYLDRLEEELTECWLVSERLKQPISSYMLMVRKIIQIMWNEANSVVGVARGSAGVMLINYLIGITQMNPLEQGVYLPPWRFLQRDKIEIPDIDVDSEGGKKQLIIQKIKEAAQSDGGDALNICTFGTEGTRSAILTACRGLGIDIDDAQYLSGMVPQERGFLWPLSDCINGNVDKDRKPIKKLIEAFEQFPRLLETAMGIEGLVSRIGIHACLDGTSKITTDRGIKNLSDVQCGDNVLTHKGSFKPVIKTMVNDTNEVYRIYSKGMIEPLIGTGNHPLLILRHGEEKWVDIEKLEDGDMVGTPINNQLVQNDQTSITKNEKMWYQMDQIERIVRNQKVYNLTVADDNSYVANGIITHNCGLLVLNDEVHSKNAMMRAPNGSQITQFDLGDSEYMGGLKMDCLSVEGMDKIHACLDLLLEDGLIEWQGSLKSTYDKYLHPDVLERDDEAMWKKIWDNEIIDIFQMDSTVGKQILATSKPKNIPELSAANSLMRLMPEPGHKTPADEYIEYKENPKLLEDEIMALEATDKEKEILYDFMQQYGGVLDSQESAMLAVMIPEFTDYDVPHANKIRKIIAKKKMKEIDAAREEYFKRGEEKGTSEDILKYIWDVQIKRQLG